MLRALRIAIPLSFGLLLACSSSGSGDGDGELGTGEEGEQEAGTDSGETGSDDDYAHGASIAGITFNQGTSVPLANGLNWVGPSDREARVVRDRDGILRVFVVPDADAAEHEIECRLTLTYADESTEQLSSTLVLGEGPSGLHDLTTTCNIELYAADGQVAVGTSFQVSLHELEGSEGGSLASHSVVSPAEGPKLIGVEDYDRTMKVKVFPCTFEGSTPPVEPEFDLHVEALIQQLPAQSVDVQLQDPIVTANPALSYILIVMGNQRAIDGEPPDVYYYGWSVDAENDGAGGLAMFGSFVAAGAWIGGSLYRKQTFVHELGHDQQMNHIECESGVEQMPPFADDYPNEIGIIGLPGYAIQEKVLLDGAYTYNYMSYCDLGGQTWANAWNWTKSWERMDYVASLGLITEPRPPVLRGIIGEDGVEGYWTTRARIDPERLSGNHIFRFTDAEGQFTEHPGEWVPAGTGTSFQLTVELPAGFDLDTGSISRISNGTAYAIFLPKAKRIHETFASDIFAEPGE